MPENGPGLRKNRAVATKAVLHGDPCIESNIPGQAFKNAQLGAFVDPTSVAASRVEIGETFTIMVGGKIFVRSGVLTGGLGAFPEGTRVWIDPTDNTLEPAVGEDGVKFGVVDKVDTVRSGVYINTNARDTF